LFLVLEFCERGDVHGILAKLGSVNVEWARYAVACVGAALQHVHSLKMVHFDVKPENMLVNKEGAVLLGDFGSCQAIRHQDSPSASVLLTGTAEYVSPELATDALQRYTTTTTATVDNNDDNDNETLRVSCSLIQPAVDFWALGCVLYQLLVGTTPWHLTRAQFESQSGIEATRTLLGMVVESTSSSSNGPPLPANLDPACTEALQALLQPDVAKRWQTIDSAFFHKPARPPQPPSTGAVRSSQVEVHVKQRKFSMLYTTISQRSYTDEMDEPLEPIIEIEGC